MPSSTIVRIETEKVRESANQIAKKNDEMDRILNEAKKRITDLEPDWESRSAQSIRESIRKMEKVFEQYKEVVNSYVTVLKKVAETYDVMEGALVKSVDDVAKDFGR